MQHYVVFQTTFYLTNSSNITIFMKPIKTQLDRSREWQGPPILTGPVNCIWCWNAVCHARYSYSTETMCALNFCVGAREIQRQQLCHTTAVRRRQTAQTQFDSQMILKCAQIGSAAPDSTTVCGCDIATVNLQQLCVITCNNCVTLCCRSYCPSCDTLWRLVCHCAILFYYLL